MKIPGTHFLKLKINDFEVTCPDANGPATRAMRAPWNWPAKLCPAYMFKRTSAMCLQSVSTINMKISRDLFFLNWQWTILRLRAPVPTGLCRAICAHREMDLESYARRVCSKEPVRCVHKVYLRLIWKYPGTYFSKLKINDFEATCPGANGPMLRALRAPWNGPGKLCPAHMFKRTTAMCG